METNTNPFEELGIRIYISVDAPVQRDTTFIDINTNEWTYESSISKLYQYLLMNYTRSLANILKLNRINSETPREDIINLIREDKEAYLIFRAKVEAYSKTFRGFTFQPIKRELIGNELNTYMPKHDIDSIPAKANDDYPHLKLMMQNIFQEGYEHFIKTLAWKIQNPCDPLPTHWIVYDDGGTGKTQILAEQILSDIFNINIINQQQLTSGFNEFLQNSTIIIAEEIEGFENSSLIKNLTTAREITINQKYKSQITIKNYNLWIFFTNEVKSLKIDERDRRFNVAGGGTRIIPLPEKKDWGNSLFGSEEAHAQFFSEWKENYEEEINSLIMDLKALQITRNDVQTNIYTDLKLELINVHKSSDKMFLDEMFELGLDNFLKEHHSHSTSISDAIISKEEGNFIRSSFLYTIYCNFCRNNGHKALAKNGLIARIKKNKNYDQIFGIHKTIKDNNNMPVKAIEILPVKNEKN